MRYRHVPRQIYLNLHSEPASATINSFSHSLLVSKAASHPGKEPCPSVTEIETSSTTTLGSFRPSSPIPGSWLLSSASSKTSLFTRTAAPCKDCEVARGAVEALQASVDQVTEMARNCGYLKGFVDGLEPAVETYREM